MSAPTIGRIVQYRLTEQDVDQIVAARMRGEGKGNTVHEGSVYPAMVVAVFGGVLANLQVFLDGDHTHWAGSRYEGDEPGRWSRLSTS